MPPGQFKLEGSHRGARFAAFRESGTLVTLGPAYARAGAKSLRARVAPLAPGFCLCFFFPFGPQKGTCSGEGACVGLEVGGGIEKRSGEWNEL